MSFSENISKAQSHPIVLFEYDLPTESDTWINYEAGVWFNMLTPGVVTFQDDYGETFYYENTNEIEYNIQSVKVDDRDYIKVNSLSDLRLQTASFYFDPITSNIYIHFYNWEPPLDETIYIGSTTGFCTEGDRQNGAYYEDVYYEPRIRSIPNINIQKDPIFFGKIAFNSGSVILANNDGFFDTFDDNNAYRQAARILFGFEGDDYSEFKKVFSGYLENYSRGFDTFTITIQDIIKQLSRPIPPNRLSLIEFPLMEDDDEQAPKPLCYGKVTKAEPICINLNETSPTNWQFLLADTTYHDIHSVVAVFDQDEDITSTATWSVDTSTGIFTIADADIGGPEDISVTFKGYVDDSGNLITNAMDVIKDLMFYYGDIAFIASNFNIAQWNLARATAKDIGIFINDDENLIDVIGEIIASTHGLFYSQIDGKYSAKIYDSSRESSKTIENYEWIGPPSINNNGSEFLSSIRILYDRDLKEDKFVQFINTTYQTQALDRYKSYKQRDLETLLYTEGEAREISNLIMEQSYFIRDIIKRKVKMSYYDLEVGDFVKANPGTRPDGAVDDFFIYEVLGKSINFNNYEITLTLKYIKDFAESTTVYTQGYLYYDKLFYDKLYGTTRYDEV